MLFSNKDLKNLLCPLAIEQVLVMLVGMVDTVMVSSVGETAVSGVALVDMVNYLVITVLTALTTGGAVILSQYLGSGQPDKAAFSAGQLMQYPPCFPPESRWCACWANGGFCACFSARWNRQSSPWWGNASAPGNMGRRSTTPISS